MKTKLHTVWFKTLLFLGRWFNLKWAQQKAVDIVVPKMIFTNPLSNGAHRNTACPCGSGKKIKRCHGREATVTGAERAEIMTMITNQMNKIAAELNSHKQG